MGKYIIEIEEGKEGVMFCQSGIVSIGLHLKDEESLRGLGIKSAMPYTEPDTEKIREEAYTEAKIDAGQEYENGYDAGHNVGYQQGLSDAKEGKATCQYCEYQYLDDTEEPCKKCCKAYMNKFKPKAKEGPIQVGDEVRNIENRWIAVVCNIAGECMTLMDTNGALGDGYGVNRFIKTGRHFPEIAAVLAKMKEES